MPDTLFYCSPDVFEMESSRLAQKIDSSRYTSIYGIPRGGIYIAIQLSTLLNLPIVEKNEIHKRTLIVDDLADSGRTRDRYPNNDFACLYNKPHTPLLSGIAYISDTIDGWVEFFWEREINEQPAEDAVTRLIEMKNLKVTKERIRQLYSFINQFFEVAEWKK